MSNLARNEKYNLLKKATDKYVLLKLCCQIQICKLIYSEFIILRVCFVHFMYDIKRKSMYYEKTNCLFHIKCSLKANHEVRLRLELASSPVMSFT